MGELLTEKASSVEIMDSGRERILVSRKRKKLVWTGRVGNGKGLIKRELHFEEGKGGKREIEVMREKKGCKTGGGEPSSRIKSLREKKEICVKGNHDKKNLKAKRRRSLPFLGRLKE